MNIFRPQVPYVFHPPKYRPWLAPLLRWVARRIYLRNQFKVFDVRVEGLDQVHDLTRRGESIMITPNHADHADPSLLVHAAAQQGLAFHFMAAREGFEKSRLNAFVLQAMGAFSVDREGADLSAVKTAMEILKRRRYPLVIFPEGEIYHHHETLDALNEGVATILLRTSRRLGADKTCYAIPTAIHYEHRPGVETTFSERLDQLEQRITWKPLGHLDPVERIYRLGSGLLALKEEEWLGRAQTGGFVERILTLQHRLVEEVEAKHGGVREGEPIPQRVKTLRNKIRKVITDEKHALSQEDQWFVYHDLDRLFTAVQLYSYPGQYLREQPSVTRIAETLLKLEEDVLGEGRYEGRRIAYLKFGAPIDVNAFATEQGLDQKTAVGPLTRRIATEIQGLIEEVTRRDPA